MFDRQIYEDMARAMTALAIASNANEVIFWRNRRDTWLQDAAFKKAVGQELLPKPAPPAWKAAVSAPPWEPGIEQAAITLNLGPDLVDDPFCGLPPDPPPLPVGVVDVGALAWVGPPAIYACGPNDTAMPGQETVQDGRRLVKTEIPSPYGRGKVSRWYQGV